MTDFATIVEQATSDHVRSGGADTSAADLRAVFGPIAQALRFFQNLAAGAAILVLAGAPDAAAGNNGDVYIDTATTDLYQKAADQWGAPKFQLKGRDGKTPKLGVDYQNGKTPVLGVDYQNGKDGRSAYEVALANGFSGSQTQWLASLKPEPNAASSDGADGNRNRWESYAPTDEAGLAGDAWYHVISGAKIALYECYQAAGTSTTNAWRLRYTSPDAAASTVVTTPGTGAGTTLPAQANNAGKVLGTDGQNLAWVTAAAGGSSLPAQSAATTGKALVSDGTAASWQAVASSGLPAQAPATAGKVLGSTGTAGAEQWVAAGPAIDDGAAAAAKVWSSQKTEKSISDAVEAIQDYGTFNIYNVPGAKRVAVRDAIMQAASTNKRTYIVEAELAWIGAVFPDTVTNSEAAYVYSCHQNSDANGQTGAIWCRTPLFTT